MMRNRSSCVIREIPLPEREYRVSPPENWEGGIRHQGQSRPTAGRRRRRRRRSRLLPALLALCLVFSFLLGRASASKKSAGIPSVIRNRPKQEEVQPSPPDAGTPVTVLPADPGTTGGSGAGAAAGGQISGGSGVNAPGAAAGGQISDGSGVNAPGAAAGGQISDGSGAAGTSSGSAAKAEEWNLVLINGDHLLDRDFQVPELTRLANGHAIDSRVYPQLQAMMDGAKAAGVHPTICSSFRTWETQERLYNNKIARLKSAGWDPETAEQEAGRWVARPGASEHQAGLAVDIVDKSYQSLDERQEATAAQKWLMEHCAEYGFILRYPSDKGEITGIGYEPWHYRYVGKEAAQAIMSQGICLEEYIGSLRNPAM